MKKIVTYIIILAVLFALSLLVLDRPWYIALLWAVLVSAGIAIFDRFYNSEKVDKEVERMKSLKKEIESKNKEA